MDIEKTMQQHAARLLKKKQESGLNTNQIIKATGLRFETIKDIEAGNNVRWKSMVLYMQAVGYSI